MNRIEALKVKCSQYPYQARCLKMTEAEFDLMVEFLEENDGLGHLEFERAVNRMFLNKPKPRNFVTIMEMLTVANVAALGVARKGFSHAR
jgi:hypothetical protein